MDQPISLGRYGLAYLFWLITVVLALVALLVWRSSAMIALGVLNWDRYLEHAINQFGFLFLAVFGLSVIIFAEHFYRTGVEKRVLLQRFLWITFIELLFLALAHFIQWAGGVQLGLNIPPLIFLVELLVSVAVFVLYRRTRERALL